jgi:hypothetical protein
MFLGQGDSGRAIGRHEDFVVVLENHAQGLTRAIFVIDD